jgi:CBS domain-containing protein
LGKRAIDEADHEAFEIRFNDLFDAVREARNDAMHQGAYARHVTWNATNLAIMLEDALMRDATTIADFMIRNVVCAAPWHTIGYVRQLMLANSFSILPFWDPTDSTWKLVVDRAVGIFLGIPGSSGRKQRLKMQLGQATTRNGRLEIIPARTLREHTTVTEALSNFNEKNLLLVVVRDTQADGVSKTLGSDDLVGIITAFDLL